MVKEIFEIRNDESQEILGYGYKILEGESCLINQPFKPNMDGINYMTEEESNTLADQEIETLQNTPTIEEQKPKTEIEILKEQIADINIALSEIMGGGASA